MTSKKAKAPTSGHKEGSRKSRVHALFDTDGQDAAWTFGLKLKLSPNTLRSWFGIWRREAPPKKKPTRKATPRKETPVTAPQEQPETIPAFLEG